MDHQGMIYLSSWAEDWKSGKLLKFDGNTISILFESTGIADIHYNEKKTMY